MPVDLTQLVTALTAETAVARTALADHLTDLDRASPASGWTVGDQVSHLAYFDQMARTALEDPDAFTREAESAVRDIDAYTHRIALQHRELSPPALLAWWDAERAAFIAAARSAAPGVRAPWYGVVMSVPSLVTARVMETWAHGQDVLDALELPHPSTSALRQVCHLCVSTVANSFRANGLEPPTEPIRVEVRAPDGERWIWGPDDAHDVVTGDAVDLCLVSTQRRHRSSTTLRAQGANADRWLDLAQCFAGPPGAGRAAR